MTIIFETLGRAELAAVTGGHHDPSTPEPAQQGLSAAPEPEQGLSAAPDRSKPPIYICRPL